ncbi:MAG: hypothetical protein WC139_02475 [Candidatus Kapaibacterium sp.]
MICTDIELKINGTRINTGLTDYYRLKTGFIARGKETKRVIEEYKIKSEKRLYTECAMKKTANK